MRPAISSRGLLSTLAALALLATSCGSGESNKSSLSYREWSEIAESDTLRVGTMTSPTDFYFYRGEPFGLEYQKASGFARAKGLRLEILVTGSRDSLMAWIDSGKIDLSITPFAMTADNSATYDFAGVVDTIALVLVQNKRRGPLLTSVHDMEGKDIYVSASSPAELRLEQIMEETLLDSLSIVSVDSLGDVDLLKSIAEEGEISYAAVDTRLADLFSNHYSTLDTSLRLSVPIRYSWMVHKGNSTLASEINAFFVPGNSLGDEASDQDFTLSAESGNYFKDLRQTKQAKQHITLSPGSISSYDQIFISQSDRLGWHWVYLAAIAFTESRFTPSVVARSGARGLMGIMPRTGRSYGASPDQLLDPSISVRVAVDCLRDNERYFSFIRDTHERACFTLAAYNAGSGHVMDAIRLARKYSASDTTWTGGVREYMLLKSTAKYFNDPVVRYGYVRGSETVKYVDNIMTLAALYRAQTETK